MPIWGSSKTTNQQNEVPRVSYFFCKAAEQTSYGKSIVHALDLGPGPLISLMAIWGFPWMGVPLDRWMVYNGKVYANGGCGGTPTISPPWLHVRNQPWLGVTLQPHGSTVRPSLSPVLKLPKTGVAPNSWTTSPPRIAWSFSLVATQKIHDQQGQKLCELPPIDHDKSKHVC